MPTCEHGAEILDGAPVPECERGKAFTPDDEFRRSYVYQHPAPVYGPPPPDDPPIFLLQASPTWAPGLADGSWQRVLMGTAGQVPMASSTGGVAWQAPALGVSVISFGADPTGTTDSSAAIQAAINVQQTSGGLVYFPAGTYLIQNPLFCQPGTGSTFTSATRPLIIRGDGQDQTIIKAGASLSAPFGGMFWNHSPFTNVIALLDMADLTLDGNYAGQGGAVPLSQIGAFVSLPWPNTVIGTYAPNGLFHNFERVRFYRPSKYGFQPTKGCRFYGCTFDTMGQPDTAPHWDNLGSDAGEAVVIGCTWLNSSGNYVDFTGGPVPATGTANTGTLSVTFIGNRSIGHGAGSLLGFGVNSVIMGNDLNSTVTGAGSYIGYDSGYGNVTGCVLNGTTTVTNSGGFGNIPTVAAGVPAILVVDVTTGSHIPAGTIIQTFTAGGTSMTLSQSASGSFTDTLKFYLGGNNVSAFNVTPQLNAGSAAFLSTLLNFVNRPDQVFSNIGADAPINAPLLPIANTSATGFALQNGTPSILTWTATNDGRLHEFRLTAELIVATAETGGLVNVTFTDPGGNPRTIQVFAAGQGTGPVFFHNAYPVQPGTTVTLAQGSALTAGAATVYAQLWGA